MQAANRLEALLNGTAIPHVQYPLDDEFDFMEQDRAAFRRRLASTFRSRRVSLLTSIPLQGQVPALPRPTLQRQNTIMAMIVVIPVEEEKDMAYYKDKDYRFLLAPTEKEEMDWECSVCLSDGKEDVVSHPGNCHSFHEKCLQQWLDRTITCPLCRKMVTPLLKEKVNVSEVD
jgi:hypothetical protein